MKQYWIFLDRFFRHGNFYFHVAALHLTSYDGILTKHILNGLSDGINFIPHHSESQG